MAVAGDLGEPGRLREVKGGEEAPEELLCGSTSILRAGMGGEVVPERFSLFELGSFVSSDFTPWETGECGADIGKWEKWKSRRRNLPLRTPE